MTSSRPYSPAHLPDRTAPERRYLGTMQPPMSTHSSSYSSDSMIAQPSPTMQPPRPSPTRHYDHLRGTIRQAASSTLSRGARLALLSRMPSYPPNLPTYEDESQRVVRRRLSLSATGDEEEEEALAHTLPSKRQRSPETSGSWASTLPYDGPCFWHSTMPSPPCYLQCVKHSFHAFLPRLSYSIPSQYQHQDTHIFFHRAVKQKTRFPHAIPPRRT